jgi:hypothetical protein
MWAEHLHFISFGAVPQEGGGVGEGVARVLQRHECSGAVEDADAEDQRMIGKHHLSKSCKL